MHGDGEVGYIGTSNQSYPLQIRAGSNLLNYPHGAKMADGLMIE